MTSEVEYFSDEEKAQSEALAGATGELIANWMENNRNEDPHVVLGALAKLISVSINECEDPEQRKAALTFVMHMLLGETYACTHCVLRDLLLLTNPERSDGGFDA